MSAAVAGSISPALLSPSVTRTITLLFASERRSRVSAVARPDPMAVPSGSISRRTSSSWRSRTAVSVVGGDLVRLRPAKTTRPTRSLVRRFTNSPTTSFATSSRFRGWKSPAAIVPETSRATTMSTPRVVTSSRRVPCCGRARARAPATRPRAARASGRWRSRTRQPGRTRRRREAPGNVTARARASRSRRHAASRTSGAARATHSHAGSWKRKPAQSIRPPSPLPRARPARAAAAPRGRERARAPRRGAARPPARAPAPSRT